MTRLTVGAPVDGHHGKNGKNRFPGVDERIAPPAASRVGNPIARRPNTVRVTPARRNPPKPSHDDPPGPARRSWSFEPPNANNAASVAGVGRRALVERREIAARHAWKPPTRCCPALRPFPVQAAPKRADSLETGVLSPRPRTRRHGPTRLRSASPRASRSPPGARPPGPPHDPRAPRRG